MENLPITESKTELRAMAMRDLSQARANARKSRKNAARRERNQIMRDTGMTRARGNLGGVYWE
jgi:hypothetical protein